MALSPLCISSMTPEKKERTLLRSVVEQPFKQYKGENTYFDNQITSIRKTLSARQNCMNPIKEVTRHIPVPVVANTQHYYKVLQPKPTYEISQMNVYLPRFIEVPIPIEYLDEQTFHQAQQYVDEIKKFTLQTGPSLQSIETVAGNIKNHVGMNCAVDELTYKEAMRKAWYRNKLKLRNLQ